MAKKRIDKPQREYTKRQMAMWQRRRRRQRIIFLAGLIIIGAVFGVLGVGWYVADYRPLQEKVIVVNGSEYNMDYYVKALEYYTEGKSSEVVMYLLDNVEEAIEVNELVRQAAAGLDITVSDKEAEQELKDRERPINRASRDIVRVELLNERMYEEYFDDRVPQYDEQRHLQAMLLESEGQVDEVNERLAGGEDFNDIALELSWDSLTRDEEGDLGWYPRGILAGLIGSAVVEEHAFSAAVGELSPPLYDETQYKAIGYWLIKVLERDEDLAEADVQVMLLSSQQQAAEIRARLEDGEDFAELAGEFSQDYSSQAEGGMVEEVEPGMMNPVMDDFIFNPDVVPGTLSEPLADEMAYTTGGYWLVRVLEVDDYRQLEYDAREILKSQMVDEWVLSLWEDPENEIESLLDDEKKQWAYLKVVG